MRSATVLLPFLGGHYVSGFVLGPNAVTRGQRGLRAEAAWTFPRPTSMSLDSSVEFTKYQGLGNDFILLDNRDSENLRITSDQAAHLCDRFELESKRYDPTILRMRRGCA